jgi:hypothetical protein
MEQKPKLKDSLSDVKFAVQSNFYLFLILEIWILNEKRNF